LWSKLIGTEYGSSYNKFVCLVYTKNQIVDDFKLTYGRKVGTN